MRKLLTTILLGATLALGIGACSPADNISHNLSQEADNFNILRRVVFYNGITGEYMLVIEGYCSLGNNDKTGELSITCKTSPTEYKKDFLGLSDNVTYFVEQLNAAGVDPNHYLVIFRPGNIVPDVQVR
jgi:hypothetical protein